MNAFIPSKAQATTVVMALAALWAIHNVDALKPVKQFLNFDQ